MATRSSWKPGIHTSLHLRLVAAAVCLWLLGPQRFCGPSAAFASPRRRGFAPDAGRNKRDSKPHDVEVIGDNSANADVQTPLVVDVTDGSVIKSQTAEGHIVKGRSPLLQTVIVGGGASGLLLALLLAFGPLRGRSRIRVYDGRWARDSGDSLRWKRDTEEAYTHQVATLPSHIWEQLPSDIQDRIFKPGKFAEQWPSTIEDPNASPSSTSAQSRNVLVGALEEALLEVAQLPGCSSHIELKPHVFTEDENKILQNSDPFHALVLADGAVPMQLVDSMLPPDVGTVTFTEGQQASVDTLAVAFDLGDPSHVMSPSSGPLTFAESVVVSLAQRRYLLNWTNDCCGTLHMRLGETEARRLHDALDSAALNGDVMLGASAAVEWLERSSGGPQQGIREGLRLFGIPCDMVVSVARSRSVSGARPAFQALLPDQKSPNNEPPVACLIGDAALLGSAQFGPSFGPSAALEGAASLAWMLAGTGQDWWAGKGRVPDEAVLAHTQTMALLRDQAQRFVSAGAEQCINSHISGQSDDGDSSKCHGFNIFSVNLQRTLAALTPAYRQSGMEEQLPELVQLRDRVVQAGLTSKTFDVCACTSPWTFVFVPTAASLTGDSVDGSAEVFDFGGETPQGLERAAQLSAEAKAGNPESQLQLGLMYFTADGVNKDVTRGLKWLTAAASSGLSPAQNAVGSILRNGIGAQMDKEQAVRWFKEAAKQGDVEAQYNLGEVYEEADGVDADPVEAFYWYEMAASAGLAEAQFKLGLMLLSGTGIQRNAKQSVTWIRQAAEQGLPQAWHMLGCLHYNGNSVPLDKLEAAKCFDEAAEKGDAEAQYELGMLLKYGDGIPANEERGRYWLGKAAEQGHIEASAQCRF